jgi:hypothetical protein
MPALAKFIPLTKVDQVQRLVYGRFDETPDRSREVFDYETSKPFIKAWSDTAVANSDGLSFGNVRGQHNGKIAAGKLVSIEFDDLNKSVEFCAKIVDNNEWEKVEQRVYTGFSPGGSYIKTWKVGALTHYTADFGELSVVDIPCNPSATFTMVKADGVEEQVEFVMSKAYEPGNGATLARSDEMAKAAGKDGKGKDFVVKARADLISENADIELAKLAADPTDPVEAPEPGPGNPDEVKPDAVADLEAVLGKAAIAVAAAEPAPEVSAIVAGSPEEMAKGLAELALAHPLAKGLRGINSLSSAIYNVVSVQASIAREAAAEGDNSTVPAQITEGIRCLCDALVAMAQEEVAELLTDLTVEGLETAVIDYSSDFYYCAAAITDLVKADTVIMEKAGARNSTKDAKSIQSMHDNAVGLGAACDCPITTEKSVALAAENERLAKAVGSTLPQVEALVKTVESLTAHRTADRAAVATLSAELEKLKGEPVLGKGARFSIDKEADVTTIASEAETKPLTKMTIEDIKLLPRAEQDAAMLKFANQVRVDDHVRNKTPA